MSDDDEIDLNEKECENNFQNWLKYQENIYEDKSIGIYIAKIQEEESKKIIGNVIKFTEANDLRSFTNLFDKLSSIKLDFLEFEEIGILIICVLKFMEKYILNPIKVNFLIPYLGRFILYLKQHGRKDILKNINLDWKLFFKFFYINAIYSYNFSNSRFLLNKKNRTSFKYAGIFYMNNINDEDYIIIKNQAINLIYHQVLNDNIRQGLDIIQYFLPKKRLKQDSEIQDILFNLVKHKPIHFINVCNVFKKIIDKNDFCFSKGKSQIIEFIELFFCRLEQLVKGNQYLNGNVYYSEKNNDQKGVENILCQFLFAEQFESYREEIDNHLKLFIPILHYSLKDEYKESVIKNISFLKNFSTSLLYIFTKKIFDKDLQKNNRIPLDKNEESTKKLYKRLSIVLKYFDKVLKKLFLFKIPENSILNSIFYICSECPEDIPHVLNIEEFLKILELYMDEKEIYMFKYISKLNQIMIYLLSPLIYKNNSKVKKILFNSVEILSSSISSVNSTVNTYILHLISKMYIYTKSNIIYSELKNKIEENLIIIVKNMLPIYSLFNRTSNSYIVFIYVIAGLCEEKIKNKINEMTISYLMEHEVNPDEIPYFDLVCNPETLIDFCFNSLIYEDNSINTKINEHFLIKNLEDKVKKIEINIISHNRLSYFNTLIDNFDITTVDEFINKYKEKIKIIICVMINQKEKKFQEIGFTFFQVYICSFLILDYNYKIGEKVKYPSKEQLNEVVETYNFFVEPYENFIFDKISKKEKIDEKILEIYLNLIHALIGNKVSNVFLYKNIKNENNLYFENYEIINSLMEKTFEKMNKIYEYCVEDMKPALRDIVYLITYKKINFHYKTLTSPNQFFVGLRSLKTFISAFLTNNAFREIYIHIDKIFDIHDSSILFESICDKPNSFLNSIKLPSLALDKVQINFYSIYNSIKLNLNLPENDLLKLIDEIYDKFCEISDEMKLKNKNISNLEISLTEQKTMSKMLNSVISLFELYININPQSIIFQHQKYLYLATKLLDENKYKNNLEIMKRIEKMQNNLSIFDTSKNREFLADLGAFPDIIDIKLKPIKNSLIYEQLLSNSKKEIDDYINLTEKNKKFILDGILKYLNDFYDVAKKNIKLNNQLVIYMIFITYSFLRKCIDLLNDDLEILSKYEKFFYENFKDETIPPQLRIYFFMIFNLITLEKSISFSKFKIKKYTSEEYLKEYKNIIKNSKLIQVLSLVPISYLTTKYFEPPERVLKISFEIKIEELLEILYLTKSNIYEKIIKKSQQQKIIDTTRNFWTLLNQLISSYSTEEALDFKNNMLNRNTPWYIQFLIVLKYIKYDDIKIDILFEFYNKYKNPPSFATVLTLMLAKYIYILNTYLKINRDEIWKIFSFYSSGKNKIIDDMIIQFFKNLIGYTTINQLKEILFDESGKFLPEDYPLTFRISLYNSINYGKHSYLIFEDNDITNKIKLDIFSLFEHKIQIIKAFQKIPHLFFQLFYFKKLINEKEDNFEYIYEKGVYEILFELFYKNQETQNLNILKIYGSLLYNLPLIFIRDIKLLNIYLLSFSQYIISNPSSNTNEIILTFSTSFMRLYFKVNLFGIIEMIYSNFKDPIISKKLKNKNSKLIFLHFINLTYTNNLHYYNGNKEENEKLYIQFLKILSIIDDEQLKEQFSEIFIKYFNQLSEEENENIVNEFLEMKILPEKYKKEGILMDDLLIVILNQLLRCAVELPLYLQKLIIRMGKKDMKNNKRVKKGILKALDFYHNAFFYMKTQISNECLETLNEFFKGSTSYII